MEAVCPSCKTKFNVPNEYGGKKVVCKKCKTHLILPIFNKICENCGKSIGNFEKVCIFESRTVCALCDTKLRQPPIVIQKVHSKANHKWAILAFCFICIAVVSFYFGLFSNNNKLSNDIANAAEKSSNPLSQQINKPPKIQVTNNLINNTNEPSKKSANNTSASATTNNNQSQITEQEQEYERQLLDKISCQFERGVTDGYKQKVLFIFANNTEKIFKGNITVHPLDIEGERLGMFSGATFDFEDGIGSDGAQRTGIAWFEEPLKIHSFDYRVNGHFEDAPALIIDIPFEQVSIQSRNNNLNFFIYTSNIDDTSLQKIIDAYAKRYSIVPIVDIFFYNDLTNAAKKLPMDDNALKCFVGSCYIRKGMPEKIQHNPDLGKIPEACKENTTYICALKPDSPLIPAWQKKHFAGLSTLEQLQAKSILENVKEPRDIGKLSAEQKQLINDIPLLQTCLAPLLEKYTETMLNSDNQPQAQQTQPQSSNEQKPLSPKQPAKNIKINITPEDRQQFRELPQDKQEQATAFIRWLKTAKPEDMGSLTVEEKKMINEISLVQKFAEPLLEQYNNR